LNFFSKILTQTAQVRKLQNIDEKFNHLSRTHERHRWQSDDRRTARATKRT